MTKPVDMQQIKKIIVSLNFEENSEIEVGEIISEKKGVYFKFYKSFIERGIEISPLKLKLTKEIYQAQPLPFEGVFGVFSDSLPDGWGKLLVDRRLISKGINLNEISNLDRLSFVGSNGLGALIYRPEFDEQNNSFKSIELDEISKEVDGILEGNSSDILEDLYNLGGSSGGARPKIMVGYNPKTDHLVYGKHILTDGYEHWIIKFPSSYDRIDIANIEYAYYKMAIAAGVEMSESKLFKGKSGKVYFGTKRFDRTTNSRFHMHSAAGLMNDNFRLSTLDYGHLMDCAFILEKDVRAYDKVLRLAAFNVFSNNRDDHSKNFSFLMDSNGLWRFAPAYDLTFSSSSHGMHSTMVAGESKEPSTSDLIKLAKHFSLNDGKKIIKNVKEVISNWDVFAKEANVETASLKIISEANRKVK